MTSRQVTADSEPLTKPPFAAHKFIFVWLVHLIALVGVGMWASGHLSISVPIVWLTALWFAMSSTAITAGYHRLFAHATYRATWPLRIFYLFFGAAAFQGSVLQWSAQHRDHHTYTDGPGDPYNIKLGFWFAHMGWVVRKTNPDLARVKDLQKDPMLMFQHRFYYLIAFGSSFVFPTLIGALWQEGFAAFMVVGILRLVVQWHMTFCVNSVAHYWGSQKYSTKHSARGSWLLSFLVWGEMDHNFHHSFPNDFRTGTRWFDFDPGKWWIFLCSKIGLAFDLRTADPVKVDRAMDRTEDI